MSGWVLCYRYTGHCPLLQFSMGQTYGQLTGQLLRGPPGLAWPPTHRTLLPPIRPPRSPECPKGSHPLRRGHERLSSSMIPGYTGLYTSLNRCSHPISCVPSTNISSSSLAHQVLYPRQSSSLPRTATRSGLRLSMILLSGMGDREVKNCQRGSRERKTKSQHQS